MGIGGQRQRRLIIQGWPGVGKTTLVKKIAHDPAIRGAFPDGVLWLDIGQEPNLIEELKGLARLVNARPRKPDEPDDIQQAVRNKLQTKRVLLIVDDIWDLDTGKSFDVVGKDGAILFTTRLQRVVNELSESPQEGYSLSHLSDEEGLIFLRHPEIAPLFCAAHEAEAKQLVSELEGLPLALKVAAGMLENRMRRYLPVDDMIDQIREDFAVLDAKAPSDRFDPATGTTPTVDFVFKQSTKMLDEEARISLASLSIMAPKPATFSLEEMAAIWETTKPVIVASRLIDWGLLEPTENRRYQIHAVVLMHAKRIAREYGMEDDDE